MLRILLNSRFIHFLISGGTATAVNYFTTIFLISIGVNYALSIAFAWLLSSVLNFYLQKRITFKVSLSGKQSRRFIYFIGWGLVNYATTYFALVSLVHYGIPYWIADFFILGILAIINFFFYKKVIYKTDNCC